MSSREVKETNGGLCEGRMVPARALRAGWHGRGYLPHLEAPGGTYFVTFRLADTLPRAVLEMCLAEKEAAVEQARLLGRALSPEDEARLARLRLERIDAYLDAGHGRCHLREPAVGSIVANALRHFCGERYCLHAWVVMPNHVHAVVTPYEDHTLGKILHSWKSFSAHQIRKLDQVGRQRIARGKAFWQRESYDHLLRNETDLVRAVEYTMQNPVAAGLCRRPEDWPFLGALQQSRTKRSRPGCIGALPEA